MTTPTYMDLAQYSQATREYGIVLNLGGYIKGLQAFFLCQPRLSDDMKELLLRRIHECLENDSVQTPAKNVIITYILSSMYQTHNLVIE